jgi:hypothetical protein
MTTVETTVTISISPEGKSLEALEAGIGQALQEAGRREAGARLAGHAWSRERRLRIRRPPPCQARQSVNG